MDTCYISHLLWTNGGYVDVHGVQGDGDLVFLRRINTHQSVENADEGAAASSDGGNPGQLDGSTITLAGTGLSTFNSIRLTTKSGRFHLTGMSFSSNRLVGSEGTGMVNWNQLTQVPSLAASSHTHDYLPLAGGTITGNLSIVENKPTINLNDTSDTGIDVAIGNFGETFYIFEPEDTVGLQVPGNLGREWFRIDDDGEAYLHQVKKIWHNDVMKKPVINVSHYASNTMISLSASSDITFFTFNIEKKSSSSILYITGNIPTSGAENHGLYYFVSFNGTKTFSGISDSLRSHGAASSTVPGMININSVSQYNIGAGIVTVGVGIQPNNGGGYRPIMYINPDTSIDERNHCGTVITLWEVEQ
jgi:hypothetical protein